MLPDFIKEPAFMVNYNQKERNNITKVLRVIDDFLPKDSSSPWPKQARRMEGPYGIQILAFDGTAGAKCCTLNWKLGLYLEKDYKKATGLKGLQKTIFEMMGENRFKYGKPFIITPESLKDQCYRTGFRLQKMLRLFDMDIFFQTQDLLKVADTAKKLGTKEIMVESAPDITGTNLRLICFSLDMGVKVYLVGEDVTQYID